MVVRSVTPRDARPARAAADAALDDLIGQVEALDMDEVRKELGVDQAAAAD